jgi:hypothetical protein
MMEDKRGTKRSCSPSKEGSPSPSDTKTPPPMASGSPPPPRSPSEISSCHPYSSLFEQGGSGKAPVINLSSFSDEEDLIADTSHDFEFAQRLYGELNCAVLGRLVTTRSSSLVTPMKRRCMRRRLPTQKMRLLLLQSTLPRPPPPTPMMPLRGQKMIIVMIGPPIKRLAMTTATEVTPTSLKLLRKEDAEASVLQGELQWFCIAILFFSLCREVRLIMQNR